MTQKPTSRGERSQIIFVTLSFVVFLCLSIKSSDGFYCNQKFCDEETAPWAKPCPDVRNCSRIGFRTFLDPSPCNCCQYCFNYLKENDTCTTSSHQKPTEMCGPHLKCVDKDKTGNARCEKIKTGPGDNDDENYCMTKLDKYERDSQDGTVGIAQMKPECDSGGWYAPRQCIPGSVCYCSSPLGKRLFGLALPHEYQDCACSRDINRLTEFGFTGKFPHCLPNGDYDELQCVVRTCYCRSHPETVYAIHDMNKLACYNSSIHIFEPNTPRYYVRDCELARAKIEVEIANAEEQGMKRIVANIPICDPDGNYAPKQHDPKDPRRLICVHPTNGTRIENFGADKFSKAAEKMDCYCARARALLSNSATGKPKCCSNGNYKPLQCSGSMCYCVDHLGRQTKEKEVPKEDKENLPCFSKEEDCDYNIKDLETTVILTEPLFGKPNSYF